MGKEQIVRFCKLARVDQAVENRANLILNYLYLLFNILDLRIPFGDVAAYHQHFIT